MVVQRCHPTDPMQGTEPVPDKGQDGIGRTLAMVTVPLPRRRQLHPVAHLPAAPGADRPWRAPHPPVPGLDRRHGEATGLGANRDMTAAASRRLPPPRRLAEDYPHMKLSPGSIFMSLLLELRIKLIRRRFVLIHPWH